MNYKLRYYAEHPSAFVDLEVKRPIERAVQRARRGWGTTDSFGVNHYLSSIVPEMVDALRERRIGYPMDLTGDEWDSILVRIADGFRAKAAILDYEWNGQEELAELQQRAKSGLKLFVRWYDDLWD